MMWVEKNGGTCGGKRRSPLVEHRAGNKRVWGKATSNRHQSIEGSKSGKMTRLGNRGKKLVGGDKQKEERKKKEDL